MYVVTKDNPYYPSVLYFGAIEEANAQRDKWLAEMAFEGGEHECNVTVAQVIETKKVMSIY